MIDVNDLKLRASNFVASMKHLFGDRKNYPRFVSVYEPNTETVSWIRNTSSRMVAEIGIYQGHTSLEIARVLAGHGELHLFDFEDRVADVKRQIERNGFENVKTFGCSYKLLDSYNWQLSKLIEANSSPIYDYVFIDGAHTFAIDALTFFLADRLLKVGGHMDFDDYGWTLGTSPSLNPERFPLTARLYTREQIDARQVEMIINNLVRKSERYEEVYPNKIFKKLS